jgi:hypothetical protein
MAGYGRLTRVADATVAAALKDAYDLIAQLRTRMDELEAQVSARTASTLDAGNRRIINVADPTQETDAVNVHYLRQYVEAQAKVL